LDTGRNEATATPQMFGRTIGLHDEEPGRIKESGFDQFLK
jgi:hypothetical protein